MDTSGTTTDNSVIKESLGRPSCASLGRVRQEDCKFEANLDYTGRDNLKTNE
jgi:hypothetical protein